MTDDDAPLPDRLRSAAIDLENHGTGLNTYRYTHIIADIREGAEVLERQRQPLEDRANAVCLSFDPKSLIEVEAVRRRQRDGTSLWRVKRLSTVLMRDGTWDFEPIPSSRTDEWIASASWPTFADAEAAYQRLHRQNIGEKD